MFARGLTTGHTRTRARRERGAVAVEFALVLPVLVMLVLGIVSFGLALNSHVGLSNAVREGARFGATTLNNAAWANAVRDRTVAVYFNADSPLQGSEVCTKLVQWNGGVSGIAGSPSTKQASSCAAGMVSDEPAVPDGVASGGCVVKVWAAKPVDLNWLLGSSTITLRAQSVSFYERTPCVPPPSP